MNLGDLLGSSLFLVWLDTTTRGVLGMIENCSVHIYSEKLAALEHSTKSGAKHENILMFVGGLSDGIHSVPFVKPLAEALDAIGWGTIEINTRSSYIGYGTGSLGRDVEDISAAIEYFRQKQGKAKVVLMGHSTGSQDVMYYLTQPSTSNEGRPKIDGGIIQASVSDREGYYDYVGRENAEKKLAVARDWIEQGRGQDVLPRDFDNLCKYCPMSAQRFVDLVSIRGNDDFFSSDLTATDFAKTFGAIQSTKLLVAFSGKDETVPPYVDKEDMVRRWKEATKPEVWSPHSGIVPEANHNLDHTSGSQALPNLIERVTSFITEL